MGMLWAILTIFALFRGFWCALTSIFFGYLMAVIIHHGRNEMQQLTANASQNLKQTFSSLATGYGTDVNSLMSGFYISDQKAYDFHAQSLSFWDFSKLINIVFVGDRDGDAFLGTLGNPVTGRTDIESTDRETSNLLAKPLTYRTVKTNTDIDIRYPVLNQWAQMGKYQDFGVKYTDFVKRRMGLDRLIIGWHGVSNTDKDTSTSTDPYMKKVNKGWLQVMRDQYPLNVIGDADTLPVTIGQGGDYENLDQAVLDLVTRIPEIFRDGLVCIVGEALLAAEQQRIYTSANFQTEKQKTADTFNMFGNLPRMTCPGFPSTGLVVTSPDNLSIYMKSETCLRQIVHNPKRERVEDYNTREESYVIENARKFVALEPDSVVILGGENPVEFTKVMKEQLDEGSSNINLS